MAYRVLLLGGGSGGHVFPLVAVADALKDKSAQMGIPLELMVMGEGAFLKNACTEKGLDFKLIMAGKIRRYFSILNVLDILKIFIGIIQSLWNIFWFMPDVVFSKGGYASFPGTLISRLYLIPVYTHESDSVPGLANKIIGRMSKKVFVAFESAGEHFGTGKSLLVGNPVRKELVTADRSSSLNALGLNQGKKIILFIGGSQGAQKINETILNALVVMVSKFQVIHQCGEGQYKWVKSEMDKFIKEGEGKYADMIKQNYKLFPFFSSEQMAAAYSAADVIVSRAGAGSMFEISMLGKPGLLIPIANSGGDHQKQNAMEFSKFGGDYIEEGNLTPNILINQIESLLKPENYESISQKIKTFASPDAADKIAAVLLGQEIPNV